MALQVYHAGQLFCVCSQLLLHLVHSIHAVCSVNVDAAEDLTGACVHMFSWLIIQATDSIWLSIVQRCLQLGSVVRQRTAMFS
jgi:hypothetical protein